MVIESYINCVRRLVPYLTGLKGCSIGIVNKYFHVATEAAHTWIAMCCVFTQAIAALYCNSTQLMELLETTRFPNNPEAITSQFFRQWINDAALFEG